MTFSTREKEQIQELVDLHIKAYGLEKAIEITQKSLGVSTTPPNQKIRQEILRLLRLHPECPKWAKEK